MLMSLTFKNLLYESDQGVAKIKINRPPLNVLNAETLLELRSALERAKNDSATIVVVITGVGDRAFCAGVDIKDHLPDKVNSTLSAFNRVFYALEALGKPTLAVVRGFALGGGCELAAGCDMIIASEKAQFGQPEITVGALPPVAIALLPKLIGEKKAMELVLTGDVISASEAKQIGLVNKVVPDEKLEETARELVAKLKDKSPIVLKLARLAFTQSQGLGFKNGLEKVTDIYLNLLMKTEDAVEGLNAFLEKRKPQWKGK
jgi:cyclohexa-1,5-dienecarbonyl-CoA hydratase